MQKLSSNVSSRSKFFSTLIRFNSKTKHLLHCALITSFIIYFVNTLCDPFNVYNNDFDPFERYGTVLTIILYATRFTSLVSLPQILFNFLGLTLYNAFRSKVKLKGSPLLAPFLCFRTVTRGSYPDLVKDNVQTNLKIVQSVGLENFIMEVVTDLPINLDSHPRIREVVVPESYQTKTGALFKARALQYCLEDNVNILGDDDYIIHLDEETLLTENCVRGILNFTFKGKHEFGQGLITYTSGEIVNWITTLADFFRVADDMGKIRFQFNLFHRPLFSWKGSYVVSKVKAEKDVTYDHGPDGSIAEDCYFAMIAYKKDYTFAFIEGEMREKSPFTLKDFIKQRKRWCQGIMLVAQSPKIPFRNKIFIYFSLSSWLTMPITTSNIFTSPIWPLPCDRFVFLNFCVAFLAGVNIYMFAFGLFKSFSFRRISYAKAFLLLIATYFVLPLIICLENCAVIWAMIDKKHKFYVVQKQVTSHHIV